VVERAGFEPFVAQVTLDEGDNVELYAELVPAMVVSKLSESRNGINGRSGLFVAGPAAPFLIDFDNDGDLDLLVGDGNLTLYKNMQMAGRNRLNFDQGVDLGVTGTVPFVADWNNDGKKDLIVGQADGSVKLYVNSGSEKEPSFDGFKGLILPQGLDAAPAVVDYDGDGKKDLLVGDNSGQINVYWNKGSDSEPVLDGSKQLVLSLGDAVVPFPVDWDADGQKEILVSAGGVVTVYKKIDGAYQADIQFDERRNGYFAAFPIDLDGSGKQLLVGQADGELVYLTGNSTEPVAAFHTALLDKVAELAGLVGSAQAEDVSTVASLIDAGDYAAASAVVQSLIAVLPEGEAKTSALQLLDLLQY